MANLYNNIYKRCTKFMRGNKALLGLYKAVNNRKPSFTCPICGYVGPFLDLHPETGLRKHVNCPNCGAAERHRLQYLALEKLAAQHDFSRLSILHFAPEPFFKKYFTGKFKNYASADLYAKNVDHRADLRKLPFADASYDFVFASHVLEHIREDTQAVAEIARVLKPGGLAILPVPIIGEITVEYPEPNPYDNDHVRAPGYDYYDRYKPYFSKIDFYRSEDFAEQYQLYSWEDRSKWPEKLRMRPVMAGVKHPAVIPVCYK
ncbi:MAG TPA: methyltransferase domain-containing protein [bacterium]|nr:methyltransferase domain-containing protein [bacterium]HPN44671.1 methyltransferase domain-containing protein [bacterium]